ncbi:hypothetical protein ElyMa_004517500 [Elysia marginata]|uniref:Uncharacterized protein n=1 Tax=Elysia marginata TaxID=1093978 RepID=A0AAV4HNU9_9GAST|nr:hypothetical protein ElyMa_004517500 [Elysia marginata]
MRPSTGHFINYQSVACRMTGILSEELAVTLHPSTLPLPTRHITAALPHVAASLTLIPKVLLLPSPRSLPSLSAAHGSDHGSSHQMTRITILSCHAMPSHVTTAKIG